MNIEIYDAGFKNKGAYLMLVAIIDEIRKRFSNVKICVQPDSYYTLRAKLELYQILRLNFRNIQIANFSSFFPKKFLENFGIILEKDIDVFFDSSGFSYSDQWGINHVKKAKAIGKRIKKNGGRIILLPQAFGPFNDKDIRTEFLDYVAMTELVYARDKISYEHLLRLKIDAKKIRLAPDFTTLINGTLPLDYFASEKSIAIIPNYRMLDKTKKNTRDKYLEYLSDCIKLIYENKFNPIFINFEGKADSDLIKNLTINYSDVNIIENLDPIYLKGIINSCYGTISSRFHAIVCALSQGIPTITLGWSHKYKMLLEEYNSLDCLVDLESNDTKPENDLALFFEPKRYSKIKSLISRQIPNQKKKTISMWGEIFKLLA